MTRIQDIFDELCRMAPLELQMDFDNAGFQVGRRDREARRVLLAQRLLGRGVPVYTEEELPDLTDIL